MGKFGSVREMMSDISEALALENKMDIQWISRSSIHKNEKNGYAISDVDGLAADIKANGLEQPLVVLQMPNGIYKLLTGERRLTAIDRLMATGEWNQKTPELQHSIPCLVRTLDDYALPISEEGKELYAIMRTNRFNRKNSDADLLFEATNWTKIVQELKKKGQEKLLVGTYTDENGNTVDDEISLKGRTREIVAKTINVSSGQMAKIDAIIKNGIPELTNLVQNSRINIATAFQVSQMKQDEQELFIQECADDENIDGAALDRFKEALKAAEEEQQLPGQMCVDDFPDVMPEIQEKSDEHGGVEQDGVNCGAEETNRGALPVFKNDAQRKEWLANYKEWGLWYRDENIDVNYYKYDFPDGSRLIAAEYPQRENVWSDRAHDYFYFHFLERNREKYHSSGAQRVKTYDEKYQHKPDSETYLLGWLKNFSKKNQKF